MHAIVYFLQNLSYYYYLTSGSQCDTKTGKTNCLTIEFEALGTSRIIYLEEIQRGKGLGNACLNKAILEAPKMKIHSLLGFIFGHNETSIKLFKKFDFVTWAHFPEVAYMDGVMRDLIILGRKV